MAERRQYRSAIRSQRMIREAFQELLREKPLEKITVTDIVNRADINRSTFYAHYSDVRGLLEEIQEDVIQRSVSLISQVDFQTIFEDPYPFMKNLSQIGMENQELYRLLVHTDFSLRQMEIIKDEFWKRAVSAPEIPQAVRENQTYRIQVNFFIGGIIHTYLQWLMGKLDYSSEEVIQAICRVITSTGPFYKQLP